MQEACEERGGSMASVIGGSREAVAELCEQSGVEMANLNCPGQIVVSGTKEAIREAVVLGKDKGFKLVKELAVAGAYHSRLMEPARERFAGPVAEATIREPRCPFFANVSGREVREVAEIRESLVAQIVSPVLFEDCLRSMAAGNGDTAEFVECGPGRVLAGLVRRTDRSWNVRSFADLEDFAGGE
jgi:[acyl-carrier-protein] S-malonyltransferase